MVSLRITKLAWIAGAGLAFLALVLSSCLFRPQDSGKDIDPFAHFDIRHQDIPESHKNDVKLMELKKQTAVGTTQEKGFGIQGEGKEVVKWGIWETTIDGVLYSRIDYSWNGKGIPNGWAVSYYENGMVNCKYKVVDGLLSGKQWFYDKMGNPINEK